MNRLERKEAVGIAELVKLALKSSGMAASHNTRLIFNAWDEVSGAARFTIRRYYRSGKLYITLNSSVVRSQLSFQKDIILEKINLRLSSDEMFIRDCATASEKEVKELILK